MRSQLSTYIWKKKRLKYSYHWEYIFFLSDYWHHKKWWGSQTKNYGWMTTYKRLAKIERYIPTKVDSLEKWEVFGLVFQTPEVVKLVKYKWVFIRNCNEKNEIMRYKAWLIAQGFS